MKSMQQVQQEDRHRMAEINRDFYERLWANSKFYGPEHFNTWSILTELSASAPRRLEVGPGLRPRLPIPGTVFVDASEVACQHLHNAGGQIHNATFENFRYPESSFDLIGLFDVIEHIANDHKVFAQLSQLVADQGTVIFSVPLHADAWTSFDTLVGHYRRYDPPVLQDLLDTHGFDISRSAPFGMLPKISLLSQLGTWWLRRHYEMAMDFHNRFFFPLGLKLQKRIHFQKGLLCDKNIDEILVICHRRRRS